VFRQPTPGFRCQHQPNPPIEEFLDLFSLDSSAGADNIGVPVIMIAASVTSAGRISGLFHA